MFYAVLFVAAFCFVWTVRQWFSFFKDEKSVKLEVRKSLDAEKFEGHVWLPSRYQRYRRCLVKLEANNAFLFCEASIIDNNFLRSYNSAKTIKICNTDSPVIVIPSYYRKKLEIDDQCLVGRVGASKAKEVNCLECVVSNCLSEMCYYGENGTGEVLLKIKFIRESWLASCIACFQHPQVTVRTSAWLGGISLALGVLSVLLALWPSNPWVEVRDTVLCLLVSYGFV